MTTGSINYSPDYKSEECNPLNVIFEQGIERQRLNAERARLEREVIEAAKAEMVADDEFKKHLVMANWKRSVESREARQNAVRVLIDFESKQQQKGPQ